MSEQNKGIVFNFDDIKSDLVRNILLGDFNSLAHVDVDHTLAYAHRLTDYINPTTGKRGQCANIHGHTALITIRFSSPDLMDDMVLDFTLVKAILKLTLDEMFDHALILYKNDPIVEDLNNVIDKYKLKVCLINHQPTAEYLAIKTLVEVAIATGILQFSDDESLNIIRSLGGDINKVACYVVDNLRVLPTMVKWGESPKTRSEVCIRKDTIADIISAISKVLIDKTSDNKEK